MAIDTEDIAHAGHSNIAIHPGELLAEELEARGLSQASFARMIRRPVQVVNAIIRGKKSITPETAIDFEEALGIKAHIWTGLQMRHDLVLAKRARAAKKRSA